jgi:MFS family permease
MVKKDSPKIKELKHKSRQYSIQEGIFASAKTSFGYHYISPFAIAINTSNSMVALLGSIAGLLGPLSQMFGSRLMEKHSRKKIILKSVFLEALTWLLLVGIAFLYIKGVSLTLLPFLLLGFFALYTIIANIPAPAWFSWMGDIVDPSQRGRWFSKRNLIRGFVSAVLVITAEFFLDYLKNRNLAMQGFMVLFILALIARLITLNIFNKQYEPKLKLKKGYYFSFLDFLIKAPKNNFGKFAIFRAFLGFSTAISSPLLAVYLLRHLQFSYVTYMAITLAGTIFSLFVLELWGKFADRYGNYKTILLTSIFIPTVPILWILSPSPIYLFIVPTLIGGVAWAGFNLASGNFIYDNVSNQKRGVAISYFHMLHGIGLFLGAGLGALLIKFITIDSIEPLLIIFFLGAIVRMVVVFFGVTKIKEVKKTKKFDGKKALKNIILKEAKPTLLEEAHEIMSIKDYIRMK